MNRALAFLCISMMLLSGCLGGGEGEWRIRFNGTEMGGQPAPDFTLTNQDGENVSLSDFKGRLVVIAFTYTACPDVCPMIESNLNVVRENLGDAYGEDVVFIEPESSTGVRYQYLMRRNASYSHSAYLKRYREIHSKFGLRIPGIKGYVQFHVDPAASRRVA